MSQRRLQHLRFLSRLLRRSCCWDQACAAEKNWRHRHNKKEQKRQARVAKQVFGDAHLFAAVAQTMLFAQQVLYQPYEPPRPPGGPPLIAPRAGAPVREILFPVPDSSPPAVLAPASAGARSCSSALWSVAHPRPAAQRALDRPLRGRFRGTLTPARRRRESDAACRGTRPGLATRHGWPR